MFTCEGEVYAIENRMDSVSDSLRMLLPERTFALEQPWQLARRSSGYDVISFAAVVAFDRKFAR